ncbi:cell division protein FtsQ/DivIB [Agromyces subbeticus]|uniref:cell division protein FtsQ/DivIB n=1 Tax=Agromyces subbeticus TaxID=293890 RepID=UPI0003B70DB4|nr:cell division protein FtsQ/DivIB [Agromyces subbeticus]
MKRPQGFDGSAARPSRSRRAESDVAADSDRAPQSNQVPAKLSRATPAIGVRSGTGAASFDPDRISTEPIDVVRATPGVPSQPVPRVATAAAVASEPVARPTAGDPALTHDVGSVARTPERSARSARRELAAAARERRRYERLEVRRFTKRSRRRRIVWTIVLGSIVALVLVVAVGAYSPLMALRDVRVEGASRIPVAEVQAAFDDTLGTPLPLISRADVLAALSDFALIETYSTETIPPGTLVVRIVERVPVGVIETGEGLELVDAAGVVIERPAERPEGQPLITAEGGIAGEGFRAAAAVIRSLPAEVRVQLVGASAATADDVHLELASGATVVWGSAGESTQKAAVLAKLMAAAPPDTVDEYDVSSPKSAVTR